MIEVEASTYSMIDQLFLFPDALVVQLLCEYLDVHDVARMDSAMCCGVLRERFLAVAYGECAKYSVKMCAVVVEGHPLYFIRNPPIQKCMSWALRRKAPIEDLMVAPGLGKGKTLLTFLQSCGRRVHRVYFPQREVIKRGCWNRVLNLICGNCPNVQEIVCGINFTLEQYELIGHTWPHLTSIFMGHHSTDDCFRAISASCKELQYFHGGYALSDEITNQGWRDFFANAGASLHKISGHFSSLEDRINSITFSVLSSVCHNLTSFHIDTEEMTLANLHDILTNCTRLTDLDIGRATLVGDEGILLVAELTQGRLQAFGVNESSTVTDESMVVLLQKCPLLRELKMPSMYALGTEKALFAAAKHCPHLEILDLMALKPLTDAGLSAVVTACPNLHRVDVPFTNITDRGLVTILTHCRKLICLDIDDCPILSRGGLLNIPKLAPQLVDLQMMATDVTVAVLTEIAKGCKKLKGLHISDTLADNEDGSEWAEKLFPRSVYWEANEL